jgi:CRISPR-associated protein Cas1
MKLVVSGYGVFLGVKKGLICIAKNGSEKTVSAGNIDHIFLTTKGITISSALLRLVAENNIDVVVLNRNGMIEGKFSSVSKKGNVTVRKEQYKAQEDERGLYLAKCFARGKIMNQYYLLKSIAKNRKRRDLIDVSYQIKGRADKLKECNGKVEIIGEEAKAAELYWNALSEFYEFDRRRKRYDEPDAFNMMLNYGYAILMSKVFMAIDSTNLDPFAGFLHVENPRRPALVVDLMEEFRQPVVDRAVMKVRPELKDGRLSLKTRKELIEEIQKRLDTKITFRNRKLPIEYHIYLQAKRLERFLLGKESYEPFITR